MEILQIHWLIITCVFICGLAIGSFSNVCIWRLPQGKSIIFPRSHCLSCKSPIQIKHNIPVVSYLVLSGKCRYCGVPISPIYPIVEIITAVLLATLYNKFGPTWQTLIYGAVLPALVVITLIDLEHKIIPDKITLPGIVFGLIGGIYLVGLLDSLIGFFVAGGIFYLLAVISKGGMGGGDIKLIAGVGALLGYQKALLVIFLGAFLGSCVGLLLILMKKKNRKSEIPFGPFLAAGTIMAIFSGNELIEKKNKLIEGSLYDVNKQIIMPYKIEPWGKNILLDIKDHNKMDVIKETVMKTDQVNIIADYEAQSASIKGKIKESKENKKEKIGRFSDIVQIDRGLDKNYASLSAYKKLNKNQVKLGKGDKYLFKDKLPVVQHKTKKPPKTNIEQTRPTPNPKIAPLFKAINTISSKKELTLQKENFSDTTTLLDDNVGIIEENILPQPPEGDDFSKYTSNN